MASPARLCQLFATPAMSEQEPAPSSEALTTDAKAALVDLLQSGRAQIGQWYMRVSNEGGDGPWEELSGNKAENNAQIRGRIIDSEQPATALALAFCGTAEVQGSRELVAYTQFFRRELDTGIVLGRRIRKTFFGKMLRSHGPFLVTGNCQNVWF